MKRREYQIPTSVHGENREVFDLQKIEKQWDLMATLLRRELHQDPELRKQLLEFSTLPVSEELIQKAWETLGQENEKVNAFIRMYENVLGAYINLPVVEDEKIKPDLTHAHARGKININEANLINRRYIFARELKRLALEAEILEQGGVELDQGGRVELPSGVRITMATEKEEQVQDLLDPSNWEKRRQLKDRVYEIEANGRKYILKERKTARHQDTKRGGHIPGRSSAEEFATARYFETISPIKEDEIRLSWEHPVGYVDYPDGYSFVIFEYSENLEEIDNPEFIQKVINQLEENSSEYDEEFEAVKGLGEVLLDKPELFGLTIYGHKKRDKLELTRDDFNKIKAIYLIRMKALKLMREVIMKKGFRVDDLDGYAFRVDDLEGLLEIICFDFEYYAQQDKSPEKIEHRLQQQEDTNLMIPFFSGPFIKQWPDGQQVTSSQKLLYKALLIKERPDFEELLDRFGYVKELRI